MVSRLGSAMNIVYQDFNANQLFESRIPELETIREAPSSPPQ